MNTSKNLTSSTTPIDEDLSKQAPTRHGVPSQDPDPVAKFPIQPEEANREGNSVLVGGSLMAGAAIGVVAAGPVGVLVGATVGAVVGVLGGAIAASSEAKSQADTSPGPYIEYGSSSPKGFNLKKFALSPEMVNIWGVFYPTGYVFVMLPNRPQAEQVARELVSGGYDREAIMLLSPETILREIAPVDGGDADVGLPSAGTESAIADNYITLARRGQSGLMVYAESEKDTDIVMLAVRSQPFSYAKKYHMLAIEDMKSSSL